MGSYCSVLNNTANDTMYCVYGPNFPVPEISALVLGTIAAIGDEVGLAGVHLANFDWGALVTGIGAKGLHTLTAGLESHLESQSYGRRNPGEQYKSEKESLSLIMTANLIRISSQPESRPGAADGSLKLQKGTMTVWTGSTDGSTNVYNLTDFNPGGGLVVPSSPLAASQAAQAAQDAIARAIANAFAAAQAATAAAAQSSQGSANAVAFAAAHAAATMAVNQISHPGS